MGPGGFLVFLDVHNDCYCIHNAKSPDEYEKLTLLQQVLVADSRINHVHFVRRTGIVDVLVNFGIDKDDESDTLV